MKKVVICLVYITIFFIVRKYHSTQSFAIPISWILFKWSKRNLLMDTYFLFFLFFLYKRLFDGQIIRRTHFFRTCLTWLIFTSTIAGWRIETKNCQTTLILRQVLQPNHNNLEIRIEIFSWIRNSKFGASCERPWTRKFVRISIFWWNLNPFYKLINS